MRTAKGAQLFVVPVLSPLGVLRALDVDAGIFTITSEPCTAASLMGLVFVMRRRLAQGLPEAS
jgi:hypothetical protein